MKKRCTGILCLVGLTAIVTGAERPNTPPLSGLTARTATVEIGQPHIVERWTDGRVWQRVTTRTLTNGETNTAKAVFSSSILLASTHERTRPSCGDGQQILAVVFRQNTGRGFRCAAEQIRGEGTRVGNALRT